MLTTQAENSHDLGKRLRSTNTGDENRVMDYFAWFGYIELWKVDMISNPKRWEVHLGLVLNVDSQLYILSTYFVLTSPTGDLHFMLQAQKWSHLKRGCRAPEDHVLCINDCDFFGSAATMNICSKCQKDIILLKQEHAKLAAASSKDVVRRSSSSDESELALAGTAVASTDLVS
ncbi:Zinc finger A20 and AN1 domain-containing stress-associated protein 8 [Capsicum chinense]|nr:Zinc finger A20 and AN1 domain-containing stress-associated protein 8 [Capsicum chinense]